MNYLPNLLTKEECNNFIKRMQFHFKNFGFYYFAEDILKTLKFIGFVGMLNQTYKSNFTPCIDIGWRLKISSWGNGHGIEAAKKKLKYTVNKPHLKEIYSLITIPNIYSIAIIKKTGNNTSNSFMYKPIRIEMIFSA